jgi:hypothetical protein
MLSKISNGKGVGNIAELVPVAQNVICPVTIGVNMQTARQENIIR